MKALQLIIHRELVSRVKTKAFIFTTILTPFVIILVMFLPAYLATINDTKIKTVYVIDNTDSYAHRLESTDNYTFVKIDESEKADKKMDALLQIDKDLGENPVSATFFSEQQQPPRDLIRYINDVLTSAVKSEKVNKLTTENNVNIEVVANLQSILNSKEQIQVNTFRWSENGETSDTLDEVATITGMILTLLMFFFIMTYGSLVMQSVVEEKSNRIIEVIISSVKPFELMLGKIIGVALTGLLQILIWGILGTAIVTISSIAFAGMITPQEIDPAMANDIHINTVIMDKMESFMSINWLQVGICFVLYFIGGYLLFASIFAMFGSAANDSQEAQQFMTPVMLILMVAFYTGFAASQNPEGNIAFWFSLIPFTSPVVMMVRTPFEIPIWELVLSIFILYLTVFFMIKIAAKIYRIGILMTGKKVGFKDLAKWINYK